jgi:3-deoxy-7-phosphoheptulonate synthase
VGGAQDYQMKPLMHGRSITDPCLAWEQTLPMLAHLADAVKQRRQKSR